MPEVWLSGPPQADPRDKVRVADRGGRQWGRIATYQLSAMAVDKRQVSRWADQGFLVPRLPGVYAIAGSPASDLGDLTEALLYAGPGAMLDGLTAGWWVGALRDRPLRITVATPRRCRSPEARGLFAFGGIDVHERRSSTPIWLPRDGRVYGRERRTAPRMPVTPMPQLALDLAAALELNPMRRALANLEYRRLIDKQTLEATACAQGKRGTVPLRRALEHHEPKLARTRSPSEEDLLFVLERNGVPLPDETDTYIDHQEVDAVWYAAKLVVEIDAEGNHGKWSQIERDHRKDMILRKLGYHVLRYTAEQLRDDPDGIAAEIARTLVSRTARSA